MNLQTDIPEITCRQILQKEATVYSSQWTVLPSTAMTPEMLLDRYLAHLQRFTLCFVRPRRSEGHIDFCCLGSPLLSFRGPIETAMAGGNSLTLALNGGLLVQPQNCERGELTIACEAVPGGTRVALQLADYCPLLLGGPTPRRWRKWLYRLTQAAIHQLVTVRFLVRLQREVAGRRICCRVVRVRRPGEENI